MKSNHWITFTLKSIVAGLLGAIAIFALFFNGDPKGLISFNTATQPSSPNSYSEAVRKAGPSVVNVYANKIVTERRVLPLDPLTQQLMGMSSIPIERRRLERSLGSGVIVTNDGYILTNEHVIRGFEDIQIALWNSFNTPATVVGIDRKTDLAVLKVDLENLQPAAINDQNLNVGDVVLAIGNPFGLGQTVTMGIVSGIGLSARAGNYRYIQTDAAINDGNSGGSLVNAQGELVGINTQVLNQQGGTGFGLAIPSDVAADVMRQIIQHGRVIRGWLGISATLLFDPITGESHNFPGGVRIDRVNPNGPAAQAGIQMGDILIRANGDDIQNADAFMSMVSATAPGTIMELEVVRGTNTYLTQATLDEEP